jgi:hypothetical protein
MGQHRGVRRDDLWPMKLATPLEAARGPAKKKGGIVDAALIQIQRGVVDQAVACTSEPGWATLVELMVDCAPRFWISACRKACSEADEPLVDVSLEVVPVVEAVLVAVEAAGVEVAGVEDVVDVLLVPAGVSALTSDWKSCCSFDKALSPEVDEPEPEEVAEDELDRVCSRF